MLFNRIIKIFLLILLMGLPVYFAATIYRLDKAYFICPIEYTWDMVIRCDTRGNGAFAASRNGNRMHNGLDLLAEIGAPVVASRSGRAKVAVQKNGMGNYIVLYHSEGLSTLYGHLSRVEVNNGDFIKQGQVIGRVGKTGNANHPAIQPHLHFEVRKDGILQDPKEYLE